MEWDIVRVAVALVSGLCVAVVMNFEGSCGGGEASDFVHNDPRVENRDELHNFHLFLRRPWGVNSTRLRPTNNKIRP
jgi:hypothetical protein